MEVITTENILAMLLQQVSCSDSYIQQTRAQNRRWNGTSQVWHPIFYVYKYILRSTCQRYIFYFEVISLRELVSRTVIHKLQVIHQWWSVRWIIHLAPVGTTPTTISPCYTTAAAILSWRYCCIPHPPRLSLYIITTQLVHLLCSARLETGSSPFSS